MRRDGARRAGRLGAPPPIEKKGSNFVMKVDAVIPSIGTGAKPAAGDDDARTLQFNKRATIVVESEKTGRTTKKGVFAGGDIVTGAATVIKAAGAGRDAGIAIDKFLKDGEWWIRTPRSRRRQPPRSSLEDDPDFTKPSSAQRAGGGLSFLAPSMGVDRDEPRVIPKAFRGSSDEPIALKLSPPSHIDREFLVKAPVSPWAVSFAKPASRKRRFANCLRRPRRSPG